MPNTGIDLNNMDAFTKKLFRKLKILTPALKDLELYEFQYGFNNLIPEKGWSSIRLDECGEVERQVNSRSFYDAIQIKPRIEDRIVLDEKIVQLTNMLFVGMVTGDYPLEWVNSHFYFDVRGFFFLHRTHYFTDDVLAHLGNQPYRRFEPKQKLFEQYQAVGYRDFKRANLQIDTLFIGAVQKLISKRGTPTLLAIAGPTAAGKTEIVDRLRTAFEIAGQHTTSIEMDNFLTDRDYREEKGIHTQGRAALHFELLKSSLSQICQGKSISIPRYDFVYATSSHDLDGNLKPGGKPIEIEPADIIFIEGNFPFLLEEIAGLINIKVVYLTDDPVRLKRKWKRDIDYRKKYEPSYFRNRFFKDQFIMAQIAYIPQMEVCDILVDTSGAALWTTPEIKEILDKELHYG
jgi:uridine kinase